MSYDPESLFDAYDATFARVEDDFIVRNYVAGAEDDWGDAERSQHPDSPQTARGSLDVRGRPSVESLPSGIENEVDVRIYVDGDEAFVTEGGESFNGTDVPFPTEIEAPDGTAYTVVSVVEPGHGRLEVLGREED